MSIICQLIKETFSITLTIMNCSVTVSNGTKQQNNIKDDDDVV